MSKNLQAKESDPPMIIMVDMVGIRDGGGLMLAQVMIPALARARPGWDWTFAVTSEPGVMARIAVLPENSRLLEIPPHGWLGRMRWLNYELPHQLRLQKSQVLFAFANLAPLAPPVPVVSFLQQMKALVPVEDEPWKARLRYALLGRYARGSMRCAAAVVVQTNQMLDLLAAQVPALTARIAVVPSPARPRAPGAPDPALLAQLDACNGPRLLYVSLARPHKNHDRLLAAFAALRVRHPDARLLLTVPRPEAPNADTTTRVLHDRAAALALGESVSWLGLLPPEGVDAAMARATLAVFPSLKESFGLPLVEAMAAGLPVCAADLPYAREVCGAAAAYADPEDPAAMAAAMDDLLSRPERRATLRAEGFEMARRFTPDHIATRLCGILHSAAEGHSLP